MAQWQVGSNFLRILARLEAALGAEAKISTIPNRDVDRVQALLAIGSNECGGSLGLVLARSLGAGLGEW